MSTDNDKSRVVPTDRGLIERTEAQPLKQRDLLRCVCCQRGTMHNRSMTFFRVRITRYMMDLGAVQRQAGFETMLGPAAAVAEAMGPDEDMAVPADRSVETHLCDSCAMEHCLAVVYEVASNGPRSGEPRTNRDY